MSPDDRRKQQILQGAFDALMTEGLPAVSYDRIAARAGVSRQLVRYHFPEAESLMLALCDLLAETYRSALVKGVATVPSGQRLTVFLDFYFGIVADPAKPRDDQVYDAMFALAAGSGAVRRHLRAQYGLLGQVVATEIRVQHPELNHVAAGELSFLMVSLMYGHWKMVASLGYHPDHGAVSRAAMDRLIRSYVDEDRPTMTQRHPWALRDGLS
ncbi:TetR/AcrR family transcriptional regulator [Oceaniglobus roseus]|uniref:TetR/AcrR family transcriptional regulator n=1 Tax=Oceaniglobus roseus TaxID=1737570 RepID=UPI000C7F5E0E|nr:TetR/AcrR family transcriptional regulator [Kandeliimicrobium roseum]